MGKIDAYKEILRGLADWDQYLLNQSGLPGPRANLELVEAVVELGTEDTFYKYLSLDRLNAPANVPEEFLSLCGVVGLGRLIAEGRKELLKDLRIFASDKRWRIREGVAIALQRLGETDRDLLLQEMEVWSQGNFLERRAVVAALCEPKLLYPREIVHKVLGMLDRITGGLLEVGNRKDENFKTLRKTLGYGWSVAAVAEPDQGRSLMEKWFLHMDKDIRWIMKENLRKKRLDTMDKLWTIRWKETLEVS